MIKKNYQNYKFNTFQQAIDEISKEPLKKDRIYMANMLRPNIEYLQKFGINECLNFIEIMKKHKFGTNDIRDFIKNFQLFINSINEKKNIPKIDWIRERELSKANSSEKNVILNRLSHEYPNEMIYFMQRYALNSCNHMFNAGIFCTEFKNRILQLLQLPQAK